MLNISQIFKEFLKWLPNWQIGIVMAVLLVLAVMRQIRIMLFVGFIVAFIWKPRYILSAFHGILQHRHY